jgi:hypothetical protein
VMIDDQHAGSRADLVASILRSTQRAFFAVREVSIEELGPGCLMGRIVLEDDRLIQAGGLVHSESAPGLADDYNRGGFVVRPLAFRTKEPA